MWEVMCLKRYKWLNIVTIFTIVFSLFSPFSAPKVTIAEELNTNSNSIQLLPIELEDGVAKLTWVTHLTNEVQLNGFEVVKNGDSFPIEANEVDSKTEESLVTTTYTYTDGEIQAGETVTYQVNGLSEQTLGSNVQEISLPIEEEASITSEENEENPQVEEQADEQQATADQESAIQEEQEETTADVIESEEEIDSEQEVVEFEDYYLERQIRSDLSLSEDEPITKEALATLTSLFALDSQVESLVGLEFAVNLTNVTLAENHITDISPLRSLKNLEYLDLADNDITSIDALEELNLQSLLINNNPITSIDALSGMSTLAYLYLEGTEIDSIQQLEGLEGLQELYLRNIPTLDVSEESDTYYVIQSLLDRYVTVDYDNESEDIQADFTHEVEQIDETSINLTWSYSLEDVEKAVIRVNGETNEVSGNELTVTDLEAGVVYPVSLSLYNGDGAELYFTDFTIQITPEPEGDIVTFNDENLETKVREALGFYDRDIQASDMEILDTLSLSYSGIQDLKGLEYAINLRHLYIYGNDISDISPLKGLTKLAYLDMEVNNVSDISTLENLIELETLWIDHNPI